MEPRAVAPELEYFRAGVGDHLAGDVDEILHDRAQSAACDLEGAWEQFGHSQGALAEHSQAVECEPGNVQYQGIHRELSARQSLDTHVAFQLTVELLTGAVVAVQLDALDRKSVV